MPGKMYVVQDFGDCEERTYKNGALSSTSILAYDDCSEVLDAIINALSPDAGVEESGNDGYLDVLGSSEENTE